MQRTLARLAAALIIAATAAINFPAVASAEEAVTSAQGIPWHPWQSLPLTPAPARADPHNWDAEVSIDPTQPSAPLDLLGSADIAVRNHVALPHWTANVGPVGQTTGNVGSTKSTGTVGEWDVYFLIYDVDYRLSGGFTIPYRCEYHASVTGTYRNPIVTELSPPVCGVYRPRPFT